MNSSLPVPRGTLCLQGRTGRAKPTAEVGGTSALSSAFLQNVALPRPGAPPAEPHAPEPGCHPGPPPTPHPAFPADLPACAWERGGGVQGGEQKDVVFLPLGAFFAMTPTSGTATNFPRNPARSKHKCACSLPAPRISVPS